MRCLSAGLGGFALLLAASCVDTVQAPGPEAPATPDSSAGTSPNAADVLHAMLATYAGASSYADRGTVTTEFLGSSPHSNTLSFETAFVRGKRFRFEYRSDHVFEGRVLGAQRYTIWSDFAHTYSEWTTRPGIVDDGPELGLTLAEAHGVSGSSSSTIASMLIPDVVGTGGFLRMRSPAIDGSEAIDGHSCWRIKGEMRKDPATVWIDRDSHLLRRFQTSHHFADFDSVSTMTFEPVLNEAVADARLEPPDLAASPPTTRAPLPPSPWVGIEFGDETTRISTVIPDSPGDQAGLRAGDQIVAVAGQPVVRPSEVIGSIYLKAIGERIVLTVSRMGTKIDVPVTLGERKRP